MPERARALGIPVERWHQLQEGQDVRIGDKVIVPDNVLGPPRPGIGLAYVTDTRPTSALVELALHADLLVCEGTYGDDAEQAKAAAYTHMTFREAATLAREAGARRLWLTHFSPSVLDPDEFAANAREVFADTTVGHAGLSIQLTFP